MSADRGAPTPRSLDRRSILLIAILLLGALLRFYRLGAQSFWNDEGNSARIAERSLPLILEGAAGDVHPPGYYLLLHYWRAALGQSELALRSLSVVAGLALVAFTYLLGRHLFNEVIGLIAAFLGAISPLAIYYSQEARMYALLAALSALSCLLIARVLQSGGSSRSPSRVSLLSLAAYVGAAAAGLYTHYAFVFVVVAHNVVFGVWWLVDALRVRPRWRALAAWAVAQVTMLLLYLPWLPEALEATGWSSVGGGYRLGAALLDILRVVTAGITLPLGEARGLLIVSGALLLLGLVPSLAGRESRQPSDPAQWMSVVGLLIYLSALVALFFAFDLYKPAWLKFLVVLLVPIHLLIARGAENLAGLVQNVLCARTALGQADPLALRILPVALRVLVLVPVVAATCPSLRNLYFDPAYARDDYRQLAADIRDMVRPGDAIVLNAPNQWEVFTYYYPDRDVYPAPYRPSEDAAERFLDPILGQHRRLFVLYWGDAESDPQKRIESMLAERAYKAGDRWYGDVRLATYGVAPLPQTPDTPLDVRFGGFGSESAGDGIILLRGSAFPGTDPYRSGDVVPVTLFWEADDVPEASYKVTLQLLDGEGRLAAQVDTVPRDGLAPTTSWQEDQRLIDRYGIQPPEDIPSGQYTIIGAVYGAVSGERLEVFRDRESIGDHVVLGDITVDA